MATEHWRPGASEPVLGANEGWFGVIGYGERGQELVRDALSCANTRFVAVCDIYSEQRERAREHNSAVETYTHRQMLEVEGSLSIQASRKEKSAEGESTVSFNRLVSIPDEVDSEKVTAAYENGILTVTLPRREESKPKKINVAVN